MKESILFVMANIRANPNATVYACFAGILCAIVFPILMLVMLARRKQS